MPLRPTLEAEDLVTPGEAADLLGVNRGTLRSWIHRSERILGRKVEPLGRSGTYPRYDFNDLAALEAAMCRRDEAA